MFKNRAKIIILVLMLMPFTSFAQDRVENGGENPPGSIDPMTIEEMMKKALKESLRFENSFKEELKKRSHQEPVGDLT